MAMPQRNRQQDSRQDRGSRRPDRGDQPRRQRRPQARDGQGQGGTSPIRKGKSSSNAILVAVILVALIVLVVLGALFLPKACSRSGGDSGDGEINIVNTEGSALSEEQIIDRAKDRYAGTWVVSSVTWQGEEGDSNQIPQKVIINVDGTCTVSQGDGEYSGNWEIDGDSLFVTAQSADGTPITKVLSIDDTNLNINTNNGTGVYVRTVKPNLDGDTK